uniref:Secreted protein n=1 Tax=Plectus sambesii TaxID=2011161 RepID=A0A914UIP1_9BILA
MYYAPLICFLVIFGSQFFFGTASPAGVRSLNPASGHLPSLNLAPESSRLRAAGVETGVGPAIPLQKSGQGLEGMEDDSGSIEIDVSSDQQPMKAAGVKTRIGGVKTFNSASGRLPALNLATNT